jgi:hypothetical protein
MSNVQRQVFGVQSGTAQSDETVALAQAVEVGDLCALVSGLIVPAASMPDVGTLAQNQEAFHDAFVGVSRSAHRATHDPADGTKLDIAREGIFRYAMADTTGVNKGDLVGAADAASAGTGLKSQTVAVVATANLSIGRVFKVYSGTEVWVDIKSVVAMGGAQAAA